MNDTVLVRYDGKRYAPKKMMIRPGGAAVNAQGYYLGLAGNYRFARMTKAEADLLLNPGGQSTDFHGNKVSNNTLIEPPLAGTDVFTIVDTAQDPGDGPTAPSAKDSNKATRRKLPKAGDSNTTK